MRNKGIIGGYETGWVSSEIRVRQGCVLSPILFLLLLSDFGERLSKSNIGVQVKNIKVPGLFFADDMVNGVGGK